jgi:ankyrin repeat protein
MHAAFREAVKAGDAGRVEALLAAHPELASAADDNAVPALLLAAYYGHGVLFPLLRARLDRLSVHEASAIGDPDAVRAALAADPAALNALSTDGWTPLHLAVFFGHRETAADLLARGAEVSSLSQNRLAVTPLQSALARGNEECALLLLQHGADPDGKPSTGWAPIVYCAANDLPAAALALLERGADPAARTPDGKSALDLARESGANAVAALLEARLP